MKKSKKAAPTRETSSPTPDVADLETLIHEHSLFFDRLVDLVPARFYLPAAADNDERPWFRGLSKADRAEAKKVSRENTKKSRRNRLDPEKSSTTLDLLKKSIEADKSKANPSGGEDGEAEIDNPVPAVAKDDDVHRRTVTYEELRERLQRRIEELRSNRNTRTSDRAQVEKGDKKGKGDAALGKRKREGKSKEDDEKKKQRPEQKQAKERDASSVELYFGHMKLGEKDDNSRKNKKMKKLPKLQALEKAKQLEEAKKDPDKGEVVSKKHSWKAAASRAAGAKVHDDPKLLKESIKKEKKRHQKNVGKWKERVESREKMRTEKQKTRADNISERIHQKKMRKIEKREKKLMRPGFEGRKEGYINES